MITGFETIDKPEMPSPIFKVHHSGLLTSIQQLPQQGLQKYGITPGGAMDTIALQYANLLLGNPKNAPCIEVTISGPILEALSSTVISVAGADLSMTIDNNPVSPWRMYHIIPGQIIRFGRRKQGVRLYLATPTGFSPLLPALNTGDLLYPQIGISNRDYSLKGYSQEAIPDYGWVDGKPITVRFIDGPHWHWLSSRSKRTFLQDPYAVTLDSNRTGVRMKGKGLAFIMGKSGDIISEAAPLGTIQMPSDGQPIILMADHPTTGGYAKIGTVISADIPRIAQAAPGDKIIFRKVAIDQAQQIIRRQMDELRFFELLLSRNYR